jgi:hypothetical protein
VDKENFTLFYLLLGIFATQLYWRTLALASLLDVNFGLSGEGVAFQRYEPGAALQRVSN